MNKVFLIGNLTKDPEQKTSKFASGNAFAKFSLAVNRFPDGVDYFDCIAFDKTGENVAKYPKKGQKLAVIGSLRMDSYTDSKGVSRVKTHIICENVEFLSPKTEEKATSTDTKSDFVDLPF